VAEWPMVVFCLPKHTAPQPNRLDPVAISGGDATYQWRILRARCRNSWRCRSARLECARDRRGRLSLRSGFGEDAFLKARIQAAVSQHLDW